MHNIAAGHERLPSCLYWTRNEDLENFVFDQMPCMRPKIKQMAFALAFVTLHKCIGTVHYAVTFTLREYHFLMRRLLLHTIVAESAFVGPRYLNINKQIPPSFLKKWSNDGRRTH